jgi:hypothetical protein
MKIWLKVLSISFLFSLSACQNMYPKAQGLVPVLWGQDPSLVNYQRQDQVEVIWKNQSFSFFCTKNKKLKNYK